MPDPQIASQPSSHSDRLRARLDALQRCVLECEELFQRRDAASLAVELTAIGLFANDCIAELERIVDWLIPQDVAARAAKAVQRARGVNGARVNMPVAQAYMRGRTGQ